MTSRFDDAAAALASKDWSTPKVDDRPREATVVQSVRMPRELDEKLLAEARRRNVTPSELIRDLVEAGLADRDQDPIVTVRLSKLHRAIDRVARQIPPVR